MNKKGIIIPIVTIFAIFVLLYAAFSIYSGKNAPATKNIGNLQLEIINLQQEGEAKLFYLDQLAKYAAQNTLQKMDKDNKACNVLVDGKCVENKFLDEFKKEFELEFIKLLEISYFDVPKEYSFDVKLEKNKIIVSGDAKKEIVLSSEHVKYGVEHDFVQEIPYRAEKSAEKKELFATTP